MSAGQITEPGTKELDELRDAVRSFLEAKSPEETVRRVAETESGYEPAVWTQMADQLGLQSLSLPEAYGGDGFGFVELALVLEEMGRALLPAPFLSTVVLAAGTLLESGDEQACEQHLPGIASGRTLATLALPEQACLWDPATVHTMAVESGGDWRVTGTKSLVLDGTVADLILVAAQTEAGPSLLAVDAGAPGLSRESLPSLDQTRKLARLTFTDTPARLVGTSGAAGPVLSRVLDRVSAALAAEQVGGARRCLQMASDYARDRVQFGRQIGSFQAIKHKCADMLVRVELAAAAASEAAVVAAERPDDLPAVAAVAHACCCEGYMFVAKENIQVHGGIGFTWEHPAHLYYRRAKSSELLLGGPATYYERLLERFGFRSTVSA